MELSALTIAQASKGLKRKEYSSLEVTRAVLKRSKKIDREIKAFLTICEEEALLAAKAADLLLAKGLNVSPVLGIPFTLKDNICTKGIKTTAAAKVLENYCPVYDATIAARLKNSGAVIIGKTNMDAWAHGSSTETSDFFTTKNPWNTKHLPGGSSGGSAATIAADLTVASIGTETAGSIRQPAAWCGVTGLKPTYGRASRYGIIAMGSSLDCPGPITKTVEDAALVMNTIAGFDTNDVTSANREIPDYTKNLKSDIKGIKIGIPESYFKITQPEICQLIREAVKVFEEKGAKVKAVELMNPRYAISVYTILQRAEVSTNLSRYDGIRYGQSRLAFGDEAKRRIMLGTYALSAGYYDALYTKAQKIRTMIVNDFKKVYKEIDVIICPTSPTTALPVGASAKDPMFGEMQDVLVEPSTIAGLAGLNIPVGFKEGLPVCMQIIGAQFSEELLLNLGYVYQQETNWHTRKPNL